MNKRLHLSLIIGFLMMTASSGWSQVETNISGESIERHLDENLKSHEWLMPPSETDTVKRIKVCRIETVCKMRYREGMKPRTRIRNLVVPLQYEDETVAIPDNFTAQIQQALENLQDRQGVTVRFIGYTDNAPLTGNEESNYESHLSLSKAMGYRVAQAMRGILELPDSAIESSGRGDERPVASNDTERGRKLNRRVEVEFWYDDPLQELPEGPQLCPDDGGETVTREYEPSWGSIPALELVNGQPVIPPGYAEILRRALEEIRERLNARLLFIGYTGNERLDRRTATVYGDDVGLSAARARRTRDIVMLDPLLSGVQSEHEGRGYVQSDDVVNTGFIQGEKSVVRVKVIYDEPLPLDNYEGVEITRLTRELQPKSPFELNVMHITVDGKPIDDIDRSSSDIQRCTDVALDNARIEFNFDNLKSEPRLAVMAHPSVVSVRDRNGMPESSVVHFRMYSNYGNLLFHSDILIFEDQQSLKDMPLAIIPVDDTGFARWQPEPEVLAGPDRKLKYLLRVYDPMGNYDETDTQVLWLNRESSSEQDETGDGGSSDAGTPPYELRAVYGENNLVRHRIPLAGGTVKIQGSGIPPDHSVWLAGRQVPIDHQGNFTAEEILPTGAHTVEVAILDPHGNGSLYLRDLEFKRKDFFYIGVADLTFSHTRTEGPADLLQGANPRQPYDSWADGRMAFYADGKISENWHLTASADTREAPLEDLFSNFLDKSPDSLFRRIDPDYYYPTYGDDGVVEETAPTLGKFYVKASKGDTYGMWGNFKVSYTGNELAQVDRGLYGASTHYTTESATGFGERRVVVDGFAAEPGTVSSYEEFRGTGGSLYYLRHQEILTGSERVRIEIRDKDSNIVTGVINLQPVKDYDIDYLQGRILLSEPLSSTASDNLLIRSGSLSGDSAYLVVRYEYTPGFEDLDALSFGGRSQFWLNNHVRIGLTGNTNEEGNTDSSLLAGDLILRMSPDSWIKVQTGGSKGLLSNTIRSNDGGFGFNSYDDLAFADATAMAYRADLSIGLDDFFTGRDGLVTLYAQKLEAGYSAPGQSTIKDTKYYGGTVRMPVTSRLSLTAKGDQRIEDRGLKTRAIEIDAAFRLTNQWSISTGVRNDRRSDHSSVVPLTQEQGERTDAVVQVAFNPDAPWSAYGFAQETVSASDSREDNGRVGAGGSFNLSNRFRLEAEGSYGDLGLGGKLGTSYLYSEQTRFYLNYELENERAENGRRTRQGNLVSGMKRRLSDSSSVYAEERYQAGGSMTGLTHATGIDLVVWERWNLGASMELGKLRDSGSGARTHRTASGFSLGYGGERAQFTAAIEYRRDNAEQPDMTEVERITWLFRNNFKFQLTPDWRIVGKLNHSFSDNSLGEFYDGGYTEAVVGYAYRPVHHDRLNAIAKYTYFYNVPTTDQVSVLNSAIEFIQKSHIVSLDLTYDITAKWSMGSKYAYRMGQVSLDREQRKFYDNTAHLMVMRADWEFRPGWESLFEGRILGLPELKQNRIGGLLAVYRYFGKNLKIGTGYNFTDFSDDLTDLSYDHKGAFFNIIGTM